jgi:hypothetical protein
MSIHCQTNAGSATAWDAGYTFHFSVLSLVLLCSRGGGSLFFSYCSFSLPWFLTYVIGVYFVCFVVIFGYIRLLVKSTRCSANQPQLTVLRSEVEKGVQAYLDGLLKRNVLEIACVDGATQYFLDQAGCFDMCEQTRRKLCVAFAQQLKLMLKEEYQDQL